MCKDSTWAARLRALTGAQEIEAYRAIDSTNARAKAWARAGAAQGALVIAAGQTAGRGRLGRTFASPADAGLYMTVILWPDGAALERLTIAAAVATCEAIEACTPYRPGIKWVNDLLLGEKKICGILAEAVTSPSGARGAVVGIGVNLAEGALPEELRGIAGALGGVERDALTGRIYQNLLRDALNPSEALLEEYRARSILLGREIDYCEKGVWRHARAEDIGAAGELLVRDEKGALHALRAGEVTMHREEKARK